MSGLYLSLLLILVDLIVCGVMWNPQHKRLFLKKSPAPSQLTRNDFFVGARVHIYSRDIDLVDFADNRTREKLQSQLQKCAAIFTPDASCHWGSMLDRICAVLDITSLRTVMLDDQLASRVAAMSGTQRNRREFTQHLCSDPVLVGMFRGNDALNTMTRLAEQLKADYAADEVRCAVIAPADVSQLSVVESTFFGPQPLPHTATLDSCTCCLILPHAVKEKSAGKIIAHIAAQVCTSFACHLYVLWFTIFHAFFFCAQGYEISAIQSLFFEQTAAQEFLEVYRGVVPDFAERVTQLCSGLSIGLEVRAQNAVHVFRQTAGPWDVEMAQKLFPDTIRAKYGHDRIMNAVHCTDLPEDGVSECEYIFELMCQ